MNQIRINEIVFKRIMDAVKCSVARDEPRPILKFIKIKITGNKLVAYSLDGYRASRVTVSLGENVDCDFFEGYIKPIQIKVSKNGINDVVLCADEIQTTVQVKTEYGLLSYVFDKPAGDYVDGDKVYDGDREHDREFAVNARYVVEAMKVIEKTSLNKNNMAIIECKEDPIKPIIIRSKESDFLNEQLILPIRIFKEEE